MTSSCNTLARLFAVLVAGLAFVCVATAQQGKAAAPRPHKTNDTVRLALDPWIAWAPAYVAESQGFWKRHGVSVTLQPHANGDCVQAFVVGKAEFALMMAGTAVGLHVSKACDPVVVAEVDWSHGGDKMIVNKGRKLAGLKGKRIGIYEDSPAVMMFLYAKLKAEGLSIADFKIVVIEDVESLASQFTSGRLAVAISYEPYVARATANGACEVIATTADFPGVMPEVLVAHRPTLLGMPKERVAALLAGWLDAVEWCRDPANEKAFAALCVDKVFVEEKLTADLIPGMLANVRIHGAHELQQRNLEESGLPTFLCDCAQFAGQRGGFDVPHLFDPSHLQRALQVRTAPPVAPLK